MHDRASIIFFIYPFVVQFLRSPVYVAAEAGRHECLERLLLGDAEFNEPNKVFGDNVCVAGCTDMPRTNLKPNTHPGRELDPHSGH